MRLIDKDELIAFIKANGYVYANTLDTFPEVDAVPVVRGEWIQKHHTISFNNMTLTGTYPICSLCGYAWIGVAKNTNYCPNCGAKMDKEDKP